MIKNTHPKADYSPSRNLLFKLLAIAFVALILSVQSEHAFAQVFTGQVIEENSRVPVPNAVVELLDTNQERVRTISADEKGYYTIKAPEAKKYYIRVRRIGYVENTGGPFPIGAKDTLNIDFRILKETQVLDEVTVAVESYNKSIVKKRLEQVNFNSRKNKPFGTYFARGEIQEKNLFRFSDLLRGTIGVIIRDGHIWNARENCPMKVVKNGLELFSPEALKLEGTAAFSAFNVDNFINVDRVAGVETYVNQIGQPKQFGSVSRCGLVLVWTI